MSVDTSSNAAATPATKTSKPEKKNGLAQELQLIICALGIYACYLRYGLLQERIYSASHGPNGEKYSYSLFLVAVQTLTNALVALIIMQTGLFSGGKKSEKGKDKKYDDEKEEKKLTSYIMIKGIPVSDYAIVSLSYLLAMVFSFTALNYMSYPMQALGKSCKMIPVMLMGIIISKRRYSIREFFCVFLVTLGVVLFSYKSKKSSNDIPTSSLGFLLLFASLFMDGVTGPLQERLVSKFNPSTHQLMFWQNITAVCWCLLALIVTGEGLKAISFIISYPSTIKDIMLFSLVSALGQNFIFYTVRNFNALIVTTITTTRKMFTILLSIFVYKHQVAPRQWLGLALVFIAITWEAVAKQKAKAKKAAAALSSNTSEKKEQ